MIVRAARHPLVWLYAWFLVIPLLMTAVKSTLSLGTEIVVFTVLAVDRSVKSRVSFGGTAPKNVRSQAKKWLRKLEKEKS